MLIGLIYLTRWLFQKDRRKCSRCNYPLIKKDLQKCHFENNPKEKYYVCPNCGQPIDWRKKC